MISAARLHELAREHHPEAIRIRRHLHMHPELSFEEDETAAFIAAELEAAGIPYQTGVGGRGVVGTIVGGETRSGATPRSGATSDSHGDRELVHEGQADAVIALRADFDALPIREENEHDFCSRNTGVMHACGHDGHTASLLAAGRILASLAPDLRGTVKLLFQPAEERAPGGAKPMIEAGVLEGPRVRHVFGQHVNPDLPVGTVGFNPGLFMASADDVFITIHGRGGHAAKPHQGVDPVVIAANLIVTLQQIVSRNADPIMPSVLTFGRVLAVGANNVIPDRVELAGTFRTLDEEWRGRALDRIQETAASLAAASGGTAEVRIQQGYPAVVNDEAVTRMARERAVAYLGEDHVVDLPPAMWGEDFAYYGRERPSCFYNLGIRNEERGIVHSVHTSRFDLDEDALRVGSGLLAWIATGALEQAIAR